MKILAIYLPQYHEIEENNRWWGEGYTEWEAVKKAVPICKEHRQPKIPLNNNYYDLADESAVTWKWQAELAREYGIYGFCIYHYWFGEKQLLEKPMEILLAHPEIDIHYCICWANETWTRAWYEKYTDILIEQTYGKEGEWIQHFEYLLPFFKDKRYIKIYNKPLVNIYHSSEIKDLEDMKACWTKLAVKAGFDGIYLVSANTGSVLDERNAVDAYYNFEPGFTLKHNLPLIEYAKYMGKTYLRSRYNKLFHKEILERIINTKIIYKAIESGKQADRTEFPGTFPRWDNTPRHGYKGLLYTHASAELFQRHLEKLKSKVLKDPLDFLYINAWNEWGEGAYLEPDMLDGYRYLEALKSVAGENGNE